jgi:endoglucanase Acf2
LRCFDPYAGHSWASGHAKFADGNNQESSSEAMNAWYGMILWGEATGDRAVRDVGIYLFTTEMQAIQEYWFNVHGDNFPPSYPPAIVTMVWGGKGANGTWFTADPQLVHAINWLPIGGGSLYLGLFPDFVEKNYRALVAEHHGDQWNNWSDIIWMYRALNNPADAIRLLETAGNRFKTEDGNSRANTVHWIYNLAALGQVDPGVTADSPLYAVFRKGSKRTYSTYNVSAQTRTVTFSDGFKIQAGHGFSVVKSYRE